MMKGNEIFEEIYKAEWKSSRTIILTIVRDENIADDICEDVFIKIYEMGERLKTTDREKVHALIVTMSCNKAIDYLRKSSVKRELCIMDDGNRFDIPDHRCDPENVMLHMEECELRKLILQKLRRKNPENYDILMKVKFLGRAPGSVAEEYGISRNNVNNRILRTKRWIEEEFRKIYDS